MSKTKRVKRKRSNETIYFDYSLLAVLIFLVCFGLIMLYSASAYSALVQHNDSMHYFKRQILFCIVGFIGMYVVSRIDYHYYIKWARGIYFVAVVLMALVQTPLGIEVNGAKRWIQLPFGQQLQPAEITKIAVILFIPVLICQLGREIRTLKGMGQVFLWGLVAAGCVFILTENLSTAVIVMGITCVMIFVVHPQTRPFIAAAGAGLVLILVGVQILDAMLSTSGNFRLRRILVWLNPEEYASEGGYQVMQGLYAIGSGGFFGKGLGNSAQKMVIPEVQNDMILSIICEELGVFGAIIVLVLFGLLLFRLMFIAQNAPDVYSSLVVTGIFTHIALQVLLNVMVVINLIPTTGITLPFISYGGTSILFLMAEMGIALGISAKIKIKE
ncbi:FtsW/RodA/SpoVE family cell cycle protein [Merdimonas faecis]|uniref:FtsW/RodA/SpoVE family cell cycle protein n=1 Tax=Merdimonas faecis TaxID=1653435 RepID=UPI00086372A4|nr:putative peptidoglycan glycosyltransferase FtsW [Merdimonas faecis]